MTGRLKQLDILRAIAVLMVIGYHWPEYCPAPWFIRPLQRCGWAGVDLFFVLSGFLVSGLLFREHSKYGSVRVGRFLIRRGFKIYPAFYVLLAATLTGLSLFRSGQISDKQMTLQAVLGEVLFLQNYVGHLWGHTWSLAVEEHFYVFLSLAVVILATANTRRANAFRPLLVVSGVLSISCLAARTWYVIQNPVDHPMYATHLRVDALMFGVALSYAYNYHRQTLEGLITKYRRVLFPFSVLLVSPIAVFPNTSFVLVTVGLTAIYVGFGIWVMLAVFSDVEKCPKRVVTIPLMLLSGVGAYSYSIYLWHRPVIVAIPGLYKHAVGSHPSLPAMSFIVIAGSVAVGIGMALLVETPFLRLRDRLYPSRSGSLSEHRPDETDPAQYAVATRSETEAAGT